MTELLARVLAAPSPAAPIGSLEEWRARHVATTGELARPIERAIVGGAHMDRIGYAFASGYGAALEALVPGQREPAVLAATEAGGAHPRAIETRLDPRADGRWSLRGSKAWCTFGPHAQEILVVARSGEDAAGRPTLKLVRVPRGAPGVEVTTLPDLPFVPEIPHASLRLDEVLVDGAAIMPGDGYADYLKPFRTVEDIHVFGALAGHAATLARGVKNVVLVERALALAGLLLTLGTSSPRAPATHLALGAAIGEGRALVEALGAALAVAGAAEVSERWARDRMILEVAGKARRARLEAAERLVTGEPAKTGAALDAAERE